MKNYLNSIVIAVAIVLTASIFSYTYKNRHKTSNSISVTGLGSKDFVSDLIVWSGSFVQRGLTMKEAYAQLDKDRESIKTYIVSKGIKADNIIFSSVKIDKEFEYVYGKDGSISNTIFKGYILNQNIQIESTDVDKVEEISRQVSELINSGIEFLSNDPQYYYTKLAELKVEMIAEATKDANVRAEKIAVNAGSSVGRLKNANMGVFQIVAQNSAEEYS